MSGPLTYVLPVLDRSAPCSLAPNPLDDPIRMDKIHTLYIEREHVLHEHLHKQFDYLWYDNLKPAHILLGRDFFRNFVREAADCIRYANFPMPLVWTEGTAQATFFAGVRVHLIPWMEGAIVLPALCECRKIIDYEPVGQGTGAVALPASAVGSWQVDIGRIDPTVVKKATEWLKNSFERWVEKPPKKFYRNNRFLWWWY